MGRQTFLFGKCFLKCWLRYNRWIFHSKMIQIYLPTNPHTHPPMTGKSVMTLQFVHSCQSPFLCNVTINPLFQLFCAMPSSFTLLNIFVSSFVLSSKSVFRSYATTLWSPAAFPFFVDFIAFFTSAGRNGPMSNSLSFCLVSISCGCKGLIGDSLFCTLLKCSFQTFSLSLCSFVGLPFFIVYYCICSSVFSPVKVFSIRCNSPVPRFSAALSIHCHPIQPVPLVFTSTPFHFPILSLILLSYSLFDSFWTCTFKFHFKFSFLLLPCSSA